MFIKTDYNLKCQTFVYCFLIACTKQFNISYDIFNIIKNNCGSLKKIMHTFISSSKILSLFTKKISFDTLVWQKPFTYSHELWNMFWSVQQKKDIVWEKEKVSKENRK